ncbi:MAG: ATP-dependent protease ATPase subunit HslU [Synergistales bacterium]|nr:ATP-dependent protease ATPase subunit HslU [Synergistales bacterium]MDY6401586.1 ATP-dependent protease ATPase subunit HslU [Synergistales bacterium]MDY6405024.1 ATP-dependent protease ATPase subunit HslU [Synergistales bacterium]MDY6410279.1 ATP-dependent protease ATPase subunit HslU [Synergistales bacterium]MDY6413533.1 ATP-dependent protease ATPase subunit HslU [Synergistales bacterium]
MEKIIKSDLTPSKIIEHLNRYIVGQDKAKRAVAIALRNRIRRRALPPELAHEIMPKNILMVGPTGVGKTEIARRLATLSNAPFVKVEATKFTEIGYVGRDVETIIRDLTEFAVSMVRKKMIEKVQVPAAEHAEERLLDALLPKREKKFSMPDFMKVFSDKPVDGDDDKESEEPEETQEEKAKYERTRARFSKMLKDGKLDDKDVEIEVNENAAAVPIFGTPGMDVMGINITEMLGGIMPKRTKKRHMKVKEAMRILQQEEAEKLIDSEAMAKEALDLAQEDGIVFLDEIDKVVVKGGSSHGPDVSREGVQRDLLPIVEGSVVQTRYGPVKTDHILFIAAGAFSGVKPSDLIPELQGRFPIRVELEPLSWENLQQILTEPENSLIRQYEALISTEGTELVFTKEATEEIARLAHKMNSEMEDIGARRLHTMMEQLLEEISFSVSDMDVEKIEITPAMVKEKLSGLVENRDIRRYLL